MTNEQFEQLVARLEMQARTRPGLYKLKVSLLALLGNGYLTFALLLIVAALLITIGLVLILKLVALKLLLIVGPFLWLVLRALWVKLDAPTGFAIHRRDAPELFSLIDSLRRDLKAPRFHKVLLTNEFNAGVVQSPRLGLFGWYNNYLLLGLPLMKALTLEQFRAVLAHEFGHLAGGDGRMSNWIYRQRRRWSNLLTALEQTRSRGTFLFGPFLNWFTPYFNAYSFPLARANEYQADAVSVRLTSVDAASEALTAVNVVGSYLDQHYWPRVHALADDQPQPSFAPYRNFGGNLSLQIDADAAGNWLNTALGHNTDCADTHPSLRDRLAAIGAEPKLTLPTEGNSAADHLLGNLLERVTEHFDSEWRDAIRHAWEDRYRTVQQSRERLNELDSRAAQNLELSTDERYERAILTDTFGGQPEQALQQLQQLHSEQPDYPALCISLGARLLARDDDSGCAMIEHAMQIDHHTTQQCCELLRDYHWRHQREELAHQWHQRLLARSELEGRAHEERRIVTLKDRFEPHDLAPATLEKLQAQLRAIPKLRKAYLVRKQVALFPEHPCYVLGFRAIRPFTLHSKKRIAEVLAGIQQQVEFPGETIIINVEGNNYRFGRKLRRARKARIV